MLLIATCFRSDPRRPTLPRIGFCSLGSSSTQLQQQPHCWSASCNCFQRFVRAGRHFNRWIGRIYFLGCLAGGVSGLILSAGVSAGPIAAAGFGTLGLLWIFVTTQGWLAARRRSWSRHRRWMIRSYALTFAAVTLRLYLPVAVIAAIHGYDFMVAYRAIAWLAWVPNAVVAELYLRHLGERTISGSRVPG